MTGNSTPWDWMAFGCVIVYSIVVFLPAVCYLSLLCTPPQPKSTHAQVVAQDLGSKNTSARDGVNQNTSESRAGTGNENVNSTPTPTLLSLATPQRRASLTPSNTTTSVSSLGRGGGIDGMDEITSESEIVLPQLLRIETNTSSVSRLSHPSIFPESSPQTLTFHDVSFRVFVKRPADPRVSAKRRKYSPFPAKSEHADREERVILDQMSGFAKAGTLTAILGPSECGKTSLLNILAGRPPSPTSPFVKVDGQVLINGRIPTVRETKKMSGYVAQNDVLLESLTCWELLLYTIQLRLGDETLSIGEKRTRVRQVLEELDLSAVADSVIGGESKKANASSSAGISGGQKRRLSIAMELLTMPSILYLDEPTTGLDALTSLRLIQSLSTLARDHNKTIILTINQPRADIVSCFDSIILLQEGQMAYLGPSFGLHGYLKDVVGVTPPSQVNIADFVIDLLSRGHDETEELDRRESASSSVTISHKLPLPECYRKSVLKKKNDSTTARLIGFAPGTERRYLGQIVHAHDDPTPHINKYPNTLFQQIHLLTSRSFLNTWRSRTTFLTGLGLSFLNMFYFGMMYLGIVVAQKWANLPPVSEETTISLSDLQSQRAFLFEVLIASCLLELEGFSRIALEKRLFLRENKAGSYSTRSFAFSWYLRLTFFGAFKGVVYTALAYFSSSLTISADRVLVFCMILTASSLTGSAICMLLVSLLAQIEGAASAFSAIIGAMATFCGFFIPPNMIPKWFLGNYYTSFFKYGFEGLCWNEFTGKQVQLQGAVAQELTGQTSSTLDIVRFLSLDAAFNRWSNIMMFLLFPVLFHAIAFMTLASHVGSEQRTSFSGKLYTRFARWMYRVPEAAPSPPPPPSMAERSATQSSSTVE